ncbi:MAG: GNAT family N-acetyltransferase [bacterium]
MLFSSVSAAHFRLATSADLETILAMMRAYYVFDRLEFNEPPARQALQQFLDDPTLGCTWLIQSGEEIVGYAVLCLGYSLEYHGRDAFVDEIYIREEFRGQGLGRRALQLLEEKCRELGVRALHLEVERENTNAQTVYRKHGFVEHDRYLMTKWLLRSLQ